MSLQKHIKPAGCYNIYFENNICKISCNTTKTAKYNGPCHTDAASPVASMTFLDANANATEQNERNMPSKVSYYISDKKLDC